MAKLRGAARNEVEQVEFTSFAVFGLYLQRMRRETKDAALDAVEEAAQLVVEDIQGQMGTYQPEVGPFPEWEPLSPDTLRRRQQRGINPEDEPLLEEGDLRDSYRMIRNGDEIAVGSDSPYADAQETGTYSIPPRPVVGPAIMRASEDVEEEILNMFVDVLLHGRRFKLRTSKAAFDSTVTPGYGGKTYITGDSVL